MILRSIDRSAVLRLGAALCVAGAVALGPSAAEAQVYYQTVAQPVVVQTRPAVYRVHTRGLYFRGALGLGYANFRAVGPSTDFTLSGAALAGHVAVGWGLVNNSAVHIDLSINSLVSPTVRDGSGFVGVDDQSVYTSGLLGIGFTQYFANNFYATGSIGLAILQADIRTSRTTGEIRESGLGFGANLMAGYEWWFTSQWGAGLGVQAQYHRIPDRDPWLGGGENPVWNNFGIALVGTVTGF